MANAPDDWLDVLAVEGAPDPVFPFDFIKKQRPVAKVAISFPQRNRPPKVAIIGNTLELPID
jgi:hypothetical protein